MTRRLLLLLAAIASLGAACDPQSTPESRAGNSLDELFDKERLVIVSDDGSEHTFDVYVAGNWEQRNRGLMFVRHLPETSGMLFVHEQPGMYAMWMKNTFISLDMVFIRADGSVSSVIQDTKPRSLKSQGSVEPVLYVLELNAGVTRRLGIGKRSRMIRDSD